MNARVFALRASAAALLLASASLVSSPPALSAPWTSGGSPDVNPCIELKRHLFPPGQRNFVLVTYDGIERLRALPSPPIPYPAALRGKSPACLAFRVDLVSGSGGVEVRQPELLRVHLVNSQDLQPSYGDFRAAALALLPRMITGGFLPREPKVNEYQVVFVPLWPQHPMFGSDPSQAWSADLADLGFADARRIGGPGDVALFVLGEGRNPDLIDLVAIRSFAADEPIVDLSSEGSAPYGPATMRWLERDVFQASAEMCERKVVEILPDVTLRELLLSFQEVLTRADMFAHHHVQREPLSVRQRMSEVLERIQHGNFVEFSSLFNAEEGRMGVVVTFLAILELIRETLLDFVQAEPFAPIHVKARNAERDGAPEAEPETLQPAAGRES